MGIGSGRNRLRIAAGLVLAAVATLAMPGNDTLSAQAPLATAFREPSVRLISQSQYVNTLSRIFGRDIAIRIRFAPVKRVDGLLAVGANSAVLTSGGLDPLDAMARGVAEKVTDPAHRDYLVPCKPANPRAADPACARQFFALAGRQLYRRSLSEAELTRVVDTAGRAVGEAGDFYSGLSFALSGMLVSPKFLFIQERAEPDPSAPGLMRLDGVSKASRLSFLLWNAAPDAELLQAGESGAIHDPAVLRAQVERMIASPLYAEGVRAFFSDFLVLEGFDNLSKDTTIYPAFTLKAVDESREQILRTVVDLLVTDKGDYRDLFTSRRTMLSSELAVLYRVPVNVGSQSWVPYEFPAGDPRAGLLSQAGFLAQYAHPGRSSPTRRGKAIREVLLCQHVPDPPPNVDFSKFEDPKSGLRTARERLKAHNENPVCAGCHRITDPIGLTYENFDGAGQYRASEGGMAIDPSGSLDGVPFKDPAGLGKALHDSASAKACVVNRLYAYSTGQAVTPDQDGLLKGYVQAFDQRGYRMADMLKTIIYDPTFFAVKAPAQVAALGPRPLASKGNLDAHQD